MGFIIISDLHYKKSNEYLLESLEALKNKLINHQNELPKTILLLGDLIDNSDLILANEIKSLFLDPLRTIFLLISVPGNHDVYNLIGNKKPDLKLGNIEYKDENGCEIFLRYFGFNFNERFNFHYNENKLAKDPQMSNAVFFSMMFPLVTFVEDDNNNINNINKNDINNNTNEVNNNDINNNKIDKNEEKTKKKGTWFIGLNSCNNGKNPWSAQGYFGVYEIYNLIQLLIILRHQNFIDQYENLRNFFINQNNNNNNNNNNENNNNNFNKNDNNININNNNENNLNNSNNENDNKNNNINNDNNNKEEKIYPIMGMDALYIAMKGKLAEKDDYENFRVYTGSRFDDYIGYSEMDHEIYYKLTNGKVSKPKKVYRSDLLNYLIDDEIKVDQSADRIVVYFHHHIVDVMDQPDPSYNPRIEDLPENLIENLVDIVNKYFKTDSVKKSKALKKILKIFKIDCVCFGHQHHPLRCFSEKSQWNFPKNIGIHSDAIDVAKCVIHCNNTPQYYNPENRFFLKVNWAKNDQVKNDIQLVNF